MKTFHRTIEVIEQGLQQGLHLGVQMYVSRHGEPLLDAAFGESRPGQPMLRETSQFWFSCSKPITAVAVAQMRERGRLEFSDPVSQFIPEFAQHGKENITLHHILTHTGGFRAANQVDPNASWDETLAFICATPLEPDWTPGARAAYHPIASWFLLAEIVQRLDGRPYPQYVRDEIFLPLGMTQSWLGMPVEVFKNLGHRRGAFFSVRPGERVSGAYWDTEEDSTACRPGSNARGPAYELGQFLEMLRRGGSSPSKPIIQARSIAEMTQRHRVGLYDETFQQTIDWGLGFLISTPPPPGGILSYGFGAHASSKAYGHGGMQSSIAFVDPESDLVVCWICNGLCGERLHRQRNHDFNTAIYQDLGLHQD